MATPHVSAAQAQSFIDRVKAQMAKKGVGGGGGFAAGGFKPRERHTDVIRTNRFDKWSYQTARRAESIDEMVTDLALGDVAKGGERQGFEQSPELVEAMYHLFHKSAPELREKREIDPKLRAVLRITQEMLDNPRLTDLQEYTATDEAMSTMATASMLEPLQQILSRMDPPPPPPEPPQPGGNPGGGGGQGGQPGGGGGGQPDPNAPQGPEGGQGGQPGGDQGDPGQDPGEGGGDEGNGPPPPPEEHDAEEEEEQPEEDLTEGADQEFDPQQQYEDDLAEWEKQFDSMMDEIDIDRLANRALEQTFKDVSEVDNLRKGIGIEDGVWATMDPSERLAMVAQLQTEEMKALAEIIGRMRRFSLGVKATRVNDVPHEAYDVELGRDIPHVLKSEFALLSNPVTSLEFYRKYTDGELLQYKLRGTEEVGKGPIVMCIDKSGSMNGQPFRWALAVAEALRRFAAEDDRDMYVMFFGSNNDRVRFEFPQGKCEFQKLMAFLGTVANGGTEFDGVLTEALQKAQTYFDGEGKGKADIVFITDGQSRLSDQWIADFNKERERVQVRVYSVFVGGAYDMRYGEGPLGLLEKISDATIPVKDLTPESVKTVFQHV